MTALLIAFTMMTAPIQASPNHPLLSVWPGDPPNGWKRTDKEKSERDEKQNFLIVHNVSHPTLEIFRSAHPRADAPTVIVCPGGGYYIEAIEHEGWKIAERLNKSGINAAVLKYRLPNRDTDHPLALAPLQDAQRSIRILRLHGKQYGLEGSKIGIMGFSAGGHLAALASTDKDTTYEPIDDADQFSARPDFTVLIYPAYLDTDGRALLASDIHVDSTTPPAFVAQAMDDSVHVECAVAYALACKSSGVPAELHCFAKGGHGYGLRSKDPRLKTWPDLLVAWIEALAEERM